MSERKKSTAKTVSESPLEELSRPPADETSQVKTPAKRAVKKASQATGEEKAKKSVKKSVKKSPPEEKAPAKKITKKAPRKKKPSLKSGFVSLVGRPNVGKSTLLNAFLGQKVAIVSDKPQTTRNQILGVKTCEKGQIVFLDNPGIHRPLHRLNHEMMDQVYAALEDCDLILFLVDVTEEWGKGDDFSLEVLRRYKQPKFLIINKLDKVNKSRALPLIAKFAQMGIFQEIFPLSAQRGDNLELLEAKIYDYLPEGPLFYPSDTVTVLKRKFVISETVREKILWYTREEVPYGVAVMVNTVEKREGMLYLQADILVERDNHRKIIIGRRGSLLARIGKEAREEMESMTGQKIYLELRVKVEERWRDSDGILAALSQQMGEDE